MLPRRHRMRTSAQFAQVLRKGRRGSTRALVVHALPRSAAADDSDVLAEKPTLAVGDSAAAASGEPPVIVGFVVGKAVGNSVLRHRVSRQLRAAVAPRLEELDQYSGVVVRALPTAANRPTADLAADLDGALRRLRERRDRRDRRDAGGASGARRVPSMPAGSP